MIRCRVWGKRSTKHLEVFPCYSVFWCRFELIRRMEKRWVGLGMLGREYDVNVFSGRAPVLNCCLCVFLYLKHITGVINRCFIMLLILFANPPKITFSHKISPPFICFLFLFRESLSMSSLSLTLPSFQAWFLFLFFQERLNHLLLVSLWWVIEPIVLSCLSSVLFLM